MLIKYEATGTVDTMENKLGINAVSASRVTGEQTLKQTMANKYEQWYKEKSRGLKKPESLWVS